ncbi:MAG: hypothetical protein KDB02_15260 [Acidimicrobiales bacterium]|nr:hypothetical protein [Acidimicrobiales bacterium]
MNFTQPGWSFADLLLVTLSALVGGTFVVGILSRGVHRAELAPVWARSHGIDLDDRTAPFARWYCTLATVTRVAGGVGGFYVGSMFDRAFGVDSSAGFGFWAWVISGWVLGAAWAEQRLPRPGERGAATVLPRSTTDYIPRGLAIAPFAAVAVTVAVAVVALVAPVRPTPGALQLPATPLTFIVGAVVSVMLCLLVVALRRRVVGRPQPLMETDLLAVDDAVRASTIHHISGAGAAAIVCITGQLIMLQTAATKGLPLGVRGWLPALPLVIVLFLWRFWSFRPWRVARTLTRSGVR